MSDGDFLNDIVPGGEVYQWLFSCHSNFINRFLDNWLGYHDEDSQWRDTLKLKNSLVNQKPRKHDIMKAQNASCIEPGEFYCLASMDTLMRDGEWVRNAKDLQ